MRLFVLLLVACAAAAEDGLQLARNATEEPIAREETDSTEPGAIIRGILDYIESHHIESQENPSIADFEQLLRLFADVEHMIMDCDNLALHYVEHSEHRDRYYAIVNGLRNFESLKEVHCPYEANPASCREIGAELQESVEQARRDLEDEAAWLYTRTSYCHGSSPPQSASR